MQDGLPRVHRVVAVIDCGTAVNPQMIAGQIESAVNYGLSAALYGEITFARANRSNRISIPIGCCASTKRRRSNHVVPSEQPPSGVGEPGLPPIAPAVANAIFALTGKRVRRLPMVRSGQFTA